MVPDVLLRKLAYLRQLLRDLAPYRDATLAMVEADHYKVERLLELMVVTATDLLTHLLAERGKVAVSYKSAFQLAAKEGMVPAELSDRLQNAAGMRNILVHMYEEIDYEILHQSIPTALEDFAQFVAIFADYQPQ
ncbi:MAG: hypothetical protein CL608_30905 [Anaerolineaceae bacterium]|nr:hypothetical protein [Anaerolineaceae bacterium]